MATATDHVELAQIGSELAEIQVEVDQVEERWLTLAEETEISRQR